MQQSARRRYEFGPFELNPSEGTLVAAGQPVALAPKPFDVLRVLVECHGHVVLKSELMASIWPDTAVEDANLTVSVSVLRKTLACIQPGRRHIETVPKRGYRFVEPVREIAHSDDDLPRARLFVGRERERADLQNALRAAANGKPTLVGISGEPGIGKTTLVEDFIDRTRHGEKACLVGRGRCLEHLAGVDAFLPVMQALSDLIGRHEALIGLIRECAPTWHAAIEMTDPQTAPGVPTGPSRTTPDQLRRELIRFLQEAARIAPVLVFIDDLHWSDESTVALLDSLANRFAVDSAPVLIVVAYRPSELLAAGHPFLDLKRHLHSLGIGKEIALDFLSREDIQEYLTTRFPRNGLESAFVDAIYQTTEGNPLFMVDLVRDLIRRGVLAQSNETWLVSGALPDWQSDLPRSVRAMVERTIRQLDTSDRALLSAATLQGLQFDSSILAVTVGDDAVDIGERLNALSTVHGIVRPVGLVSGSDERMGVHFAFVHSLHREALHSALSATRRSLLSGAVACAILERHRDHVWDVASTLTSLFEAAHDHAQAAEYALIAAQQALRMSGYCEAIGFARRGLHLLESVPASPERAYRQLMLLVTLAAALGATEGHGVPEVREAYRKARELCRHTSDWFQLVPIVIGLWSFHASRGAFDQAHELGSELLALANEADAPGLRARGHVMHGGALAHLGRLAEARTELEQARNDYDAHADPCPFILDAGVHTLCERAELLAIMGYADQAQRSCQDALALARRLNTPYNITFALFFCAVIRRRRGEAVEALKSADAAIEQSSKHEILDALSWSTGLRGWALCRRGRIAEGLSGIGDALASTRRMGSNVARAPLLAILADAYLSARRAEDGLAAVEEATVGECERGERLCLSELDRLRGDLLMLSGDVRQRRKADACYIRAINVAQSQGAKLFELLAMTRLCSLRREAGSDRIPWRALSALYDSFTEGRSTPALSDARKLLSAVGYPTGQADRERARRQRQ